jgi:hypothetical protein
VDVDFSKNSWKLCILLVIKLRLKTVYTIEGEEQSGGKKDCKFTNVLLLVKCDFPFYFSLQFSNILKLEC